MSYLTFYGGQAWVRSSPPAVDPANTDLLPNVSEVTVSISQDEEQRGPYLSNGDNSKFTLITGVTCEISFSVDVPQALSATLDLLRTSANSAASVWFRYREGLATDGGATIYTITNGYVTSFESAGGADGISASVTIKGKVTITKPT